MRIVSKVARAARAAAVAVWALVAGAFGTGGHVVADRKAMYGEDPANDPYSAEYDPKAGRGRGQD